MLRNTKETIKHLGWGITYLLGEPALGLKGCSGLSRSPTLGGGAAAAARRQRRDGDGAAAAAARAVSRDGCVACVDSDIKSPL